MPLERIGFVPLPPGDEAGFDHADVYAPGRLAYVAHTGANRIDVIDCANRCHLRSLPDLPGVAGVLIEERDDLLFTSDRGCARVSVFRCSDERLLGQVAVGPHQNGLAYVRAARRLCSFNLGEPIGEGCTTSVIDVDRHEVIAELPLPGRPRWAVYDEQREVVYANIRTLPRSRGPRLQSQPLPKAAARPSTGRASGCSAERLCAPLAVTCQELLTPDARTYRCGADAATARFRVERRRDHEAL